MTFCANSAGCATTQLGDSFPSCITAEEFKDGLLDFYVWLAASGQLVTPLPPYPGTWPEEREVDPETKKPFPKPPTRSRKERFEKLLRDPSFHEELGDSIVVE